MSSARNPSPPFSNQASNDTLARSCDAHVKCPNRGTRLQLERQNSRSPGRFGLTNHATCQAPEACSSPSTPNFLLDRGSIKSSLSLPTRAKMSFGEWKFGMETKRLPEAFREFGRKCSFESQQPMRQGREWVWVLESNRFKRQSSEPLNAPTEILTPKRIRKLLPDRKIDSAFQSRVQSRSKIPNEEDQAKSLDPDGSRTQDMAVSRRSASSRGLTITPKSSQTRSKIFRGLQYISPTYPHFRAPDGKPEGLYCKTRRGIRIGRPRKSHKKISQVALQSEEDLHSRTTTTLMGAASALRQPHAKMSFLEVDSVGPSISQPDRKRAGIGIAPWHRTNSQYSIWSATSSIRQVLRGKTPVTTPNPEMQYCGRHGKKYIKIDITNEEEPTFLPSEAKQVDSQPMSLETDRSYLQGFFTDPSPSFGNQEPDFASASITTFSPVRSQTPTKSKGTSERKREWWDGLETTLVNDAPIFKDIIEPVIRGQIEPPRLEWNTPEHLPNSPLCPLMRKEIHGYSEGNDEICVFHRRK